jgi:3-phosphoshikimate 1-carboxyvinyltransferase
MLRAVAAGVLSGSTVRIANPSLCEDARAALGAARSLGADVMWTGDQVAVRGGAYPREAEIDCGESGLSLRLFAPIAALFDGRTTLTGRGTLLRRPVGPIERPLAELGASGTTRDGFLPVAVRGPLEGGRAIVDASGGSQFLTGLLMALPKAKADSILTVPRLSSVPYIQMTLTLLREFGVAVEHDDFREFRIAGRQTYHRDAYRVEGDWSGAAFLLVAGALAGRVRVLGLDPESPQGDKRILDVLRTAGADVAVGPGAVEVAAAPLRPFRFDATDCPDLVPPLVALAAGAAGVSIIRGAGRLDHKESRRAEALAEVFGALGVAVERDGDNLRIQGGPIRSGAVNSHDDHRIAMAAAAAALSAEGVVVIEGAESAAKSYPGFFEDLKSLGGRVDE